ncbi:hypothetical protein B0T21DRAFT_291060 [Apiosordaria backusii]|uniref:RBR-type E3 ubiquitin transferase n=1 Tax=Apiosordaria backusii TaxID=314023 RepID=A0AA40BE16_9PEZI|nr:hypothetical protein B0T21DRAFT_291060 [Apiosordaria backusii]
MPRQTIRLPLRPAGARPAKLPCMFFAQGRCRNGSSCTFSHDAAPGSTTRPDTASGPKPTDTRDAKAKVTCHFFLKGACLKGDSCPFAHPESVNPSPAVGSGGPSTDDLLVSANDGPEDKPDDWIRQLGGAVIQFGDGAAVLKASLQSDFSAVRISQLPANSTPDTISQLLGQLGFTVAVDKIRLAPSPHPSHRVADVRVEDPTFAKRFISAVDAQKEASTKDIRVIPINAPMPGGSGMHRVECKKVLCSWYRPFMTAWLNFTSSGLAQTIHEKYTSGRYKVLNQNVTSHTPKRSGSWTTVMLTEVPAEAPDDDITKSIPANMMPRNIETGTPSFKYNARVANALVKSKLMEVGPLEWWEDAVFGGKRAKAKARFQDDGDAAKAASLLNGWELPFHKKGKLTVQAIYSARFKVQERIYQAIKPIIEEHSATWQAKKVYLAAYEPARYSTLRVLKFEGEDNKAVAEAKRRLEQILEGHMATDKGKPIWSPAFTVNGDVFQKIKEIEQLLNIVIVRNKRLSRVYIFGLEDKCKEAETRLALIAQQDASTTNIIKLDAAQFAWACRGGFKSITEVLGRKARFDIVSDPKQIVVTGSEADVKLTTDLIKAQKEPSGSSSSKQSTTDDCSICWMEPENPITTDCGHSYCSDCFEQLCVSATSSSKADFILRCEGDSSKCQEAFHLEFLQERLSSQLFEEVLNASFKSYVSHRPDALRYCPTPDCGQIYRAATGTFTCPNCLTPVCTTCHATHQGMTCADYKFVSSGGDIALKQAKQRLGIKDCPKCKTAIEKTEGCDHMTCGGCGTHICWKCLKTFGTGNECYAHMNRAHGGIGIDVPDEVRW